MKYFITGGTGFIGKQLIEDLLDQQAEVIVLTRDKTKAAKMFGDKVKPI